MLLWQIRATAAIGLGDPLPGYEAGQKLLAEGAADSDDANVQHLLAQLRLKGWFDKERAATGAATTPHRARSEGEKRLSQAVASNVEKFEIIWFKADSFLVSNRDGQGPWIRYD
jgi:hypothetical protein